MTHALTSQYKKDFFNYVVLVPSLAATVSAQANINFEADTEFTVVKFEFFADIAGAAQTDSTRVIPLVTVAMTDSGSGRNLQNAPVPIHSLCGIGELGMVLPVPRTFAPNSTLSFTFTNESAATTYTNLRMILTGFKTFAF